MMELFAEGGWGMYPVLVFGLLLVGTSARYAWDGEPMRLRFALALSALLIVSTLNAMLTDLGAVFDYVSDPARTPDAALARTLCTGLKESTRPGRARRRAPCRWRSSSSPSASTAASSASCARRRERLRAQ
ncbi:MAG: hypothetical protein M5U28_03745, partial [Sandaracinaceae bacterium]|nr:hypothetical protein [Sandaracinaceae bacterium]